jgi:hypothetical protein
MTAAPPPVEGNASAGETDVGGTLRGMAPIPIGCGLAAAVAVGVGAALAGGGVAKTAGISIAAGLVSGAVCLLWLFFKLKEDEATNGLSKAPREVHQGRTTFRTLAVVFGILVISLAPWFFQIVSGSGLREPNGGIAITGLMVAVVSALIIFVATVVGGRAVHAYLMTTRRLRVVIGMGLIAFAVAAAVILLPVLADSDHWKGRRALIVFGGIIVAVFVSGVLLVKG